ncbi:MAG: hypothetical protein WAU17_17870, partial [Nitrospirales bacterium]
FVQQGRSHFCAQSVLSVREHGKMARTPLAAFFNSPILTFHPDFGMMQDKFSWFLSLTSHTQRFGYPVIRRG